jgi:Amino acid synthesis
MPDVVIRKRLVTVEEIYHEGGPRAAAPHRRAAVLAVIRNPFAGAMPRRSHPSWTI